MDWKTVVALPPEVDEDAVAQELVAHVEDKPELAPREPWTIKTLGQADWCMRRVAEAEAIVAELDDEIGRWRAARTRAAAAADWFVARLKEWGLAEREQTPSRATLTVPHGTVSTRKSTERIEVVDEPLAVAWAKQSCEDAVKVEYSLLVSRLGACVRIADMVREWRATRITTGEVEHQPQQPVVEFTAERLAEVQQRLGDEFVVEAGIWRMAVDALGVPVPGLGVRGATTTATVRAYAQ